MLADIINAEIGLEVIDTAEDGEELIEKARYWQPDLVVADFNMPKNGGLFIFRQIQREYDIPILMLIGRGTLSNNFIYEAMRGGVYDFIKIPRQLLYPQFRVIKDEIVQKIRAVIHIKNCRTQVLKTGKSLKYAEPVPALTFGRQRIRAPKAIVVIGASTGGTKAIEHIIKKIKPGSEAVFLVAMHLPENFTKGFIQRMKQITPLRVVEGKVGVRLEADKIIIAPGNRNMIVNPTMGVKSNLRIDFSEEESDLFDRPSIDLLMKSVAGVSGQNTLGVILTGMGTDGTAGTKAILKNGGETIAQDAASSAIFGMAKSAIEKGFITKVLALIHIPDYINRFAEYHRIQPNKLLY